MILCISEPGKDPKEYHFNDGPIHIGRHQGCQITLPDNMISRQHAVIYTTLEGQAILKDLGSANGTLLNGQTVKEHPLETGDCIQLGRFHIEVNFLDERETHSSLIADDTTFDSHRELQILTREFPDPQGQDIQFPSNRSTDFARTCRALSTSDSPQAIMQTLLIIVLQQFHASRVWCTLRANINGRDALALGITDKGQAISQNDIELQHEIQHALDTGHFLLIPDTGQDSRLKIPCSAMIAPLSEWHTPVGILYIDRNTDWKPYTQKDLDYLMFIAIQAGTLLAKAPQHPPKQNHTQN